MAILQQSFGVEVELTEPGCYCPGDPKLAEAFDKVTMLQPDQINMAVCFWYLAKGTCPVYATLQAYTGQVTLYKVPEIHGHV